MIKKLLTLVPILTLLVESVSSKLYLKLRFRLFEDEKLKIIQDKVLKGETYGVILDLKVVLRIKESRYFIHLK